MTVDGLDQLVALLDAGRYGTAEPELRRLRELHPSELPLVLLHGEALHNLGRLEEAALTYLQAISLAPQEHEPLRLLGVVLEQAGDSEQALALYRQALELAPEDVDSLYCLGRLLSRRGSIDEARPCFEAIRRIDARNAWAPYMLGADARRLGDQAEALRHLQEARALAGDDRQSSLWILLELIFLLSSSEKAGSAAYLEATAAFWERVRAASPPEREQGEAAATLTQPHPDQAPPPRAVIAEPLRIGILCADLGDHVVGSFLQAFLEARPRQRLFVELIATELRFEASAEGIASQADAALSVVGLGPREGRDRLRERQYDVLVETAGFTHPRGLELLAERCAPVQCHWIGYHASLGLESLDWFLGDEVFTPADFAPQFRERIWALPRPWLARSPRQPLPAAASSADDDAPVLGSFNQLAKLSDTTLDHWAAALAAVPAARLVIKDRHTSSASGCERIRRELGRRGIASDRLTFLARMADPLDHLRAYNGIDIALDATPWSSSCTAFDALGMGVPLVAIRGDRASARMSSSLLHGIGRPEWIAGDPEAFAAIVTGLAADITAIRRDKPALQERVLAGPLFDPADLAERVSEAFRQMRRLAG